MTVPRGDGAPAEEEVMTTKIPGVSPAFQAFLSEAPVHAQAWMTAVRGLEAATALDRKTAELAYLAVLAALGLESGVPFHARQAREAGASRAELISAILIGLPAAGNGVMQSLPAALAAYDAP
jgi:AhpD family alkylhydroperoxidase